MTLHTSVLPAEVLAFLDVHSQGNYIDCTFGGAGHTESILRALGSRGSMLALELDTEAIQKGKKKLEKYSSQLTVHQGNFRDLAAIVEGLHFGPVNGILYDFGLSMDLIKSSERGFTFMGDEPLDMRFDASQPFTAADLLNTWSEKQLADIIYYFGEEPFGRAIAKRIVEARKKEPFATTKQLVEIVGAAVTAAYRHKKTHYATKTFQAIRMAVNDELGAIEETLKAAEKIVVPGGRIVVISFHSLEDRIVKNLFREAADRGEFKLLTKRPVVPTEEEIKKNPASRSAKLRAIEKIG